MKSESLILGTLTGSICRFADNNTLPVFLKTLAYSMAVNRPTTAGEAYNLIEDICFEMNDAERLEGKTSPTPCRDIFDADELQQNAAADIFRTRHDCSPIIIARELITTPNGCGTAGGMI